MKDTPSKPSKPSKPSTSEPGPSAPARTVEQVARELGREVIDTLAPAAAEAHREWASQRVAELRAERERFLRDIDRRIAAADGYTRMVAAAVVRAHDRARIASPGSGAA